MRIKSRPTRISTPKVSGRRSWSSCWLAEKKLDVIVHCLKDMPASLPQSW
ncbi:uncharacterized protein RCC_03178 [Ramularia collo-cygni]|uniref:Hydroxymethylbilane synthase n=1 Tax=Ramularia collo-cygni TaxID=112498 RepID=A0A2D3V4D2_9PEZI|nr:uncharacterized protein RCC_03178 [Ramularia collo-cygni]CZT17344.1 uncharacterized protein RCC_03178 [Ramularia collo-cygni]